MTLQYDETIRRLPRGERDVAIRVMTREDLPALRAFDIEMTALLDERNAQVAPGKESCAGGPWSEDEWLAEHFDKYAERGCITLLAEDGDGKGVGFADRPLARASTWSASTSSTSTTHLDLSSCCSRRPRRSP